MNEGHHSGEEKTDGKGKDGQTIPMQLREKNWWITDNHIWLNCGHIKGETENTLVAAQYQAV